MNSTDMNPSAAWKTFFCEWPGELARKGVLVTKFGEQIPFSDFLVSETMVLLERSMPDTIGARKLIIPYEQVAALKLVEVVKNKAFQPLGFRTSGTA